MSSESIAKINPNIAHEAVRPAIIPDGLLNANFIEGADCIVLLYYNNQIFRLLVLFLYNDSMTNYQTYNYYNI